MAIPKPEPKDWQIANAQELRATDREVLEMLRDAKKRVDAELKALLEANRSNLSDGIKRARLEQSRTLLMAEQAKVFQRLGDIVEARRLRSAVRAQRLSAAATAALLRLVGKGPEAQSLYDGALQSSQRAIDVALQRMGYSALPLARRIYNTSVWMGGRLGKLINQTLATTLNAQTFAKTARDWFNPNTPGGIRYAAMRLARTEINNAFHSMTVQKAADKPWVGEMEWNLSKSHPAPDICNKVAEESPYPVAKVPARPHPQCMCYVTEKPVDEDEWIDRFVEGEFDEYLDDELEKIGVPKETPQPAPAVIAMSPLRRAINSGVKTVRKLTGGVAAQTDLLETNDGTKLVRKTMGGEAIRGIDHLNDPKRQADAEQLSSLVLQGLGSKAPTVEREADNQILMSFVDDAKPALEYGFNNAIQDQLAKDLGPAIALFDTVCANLDRNPGNWMVKVGSRKDDSAVFPIDHGFAFSFEPGKEMDPSPYANRFGAIAYSRSPFWRLTHGGDRGIGYNTPGAANWADNDFSPADVDRMRKVLNDLRPDFEQLGRLDWYQASLRRLNAFAAFAKGTEDLL